uniref:Reverse transcriptase domain-containing protein n=1 Tax=Tanacetum cinerariifolium TaxID=118510 RepID=A0A6L2JP60_TANCI|nr:reverse transcriptase domain-containing protein [Tanacetum cinerariifolium]
MDAEGNGDPPVPDLRTMEELCQPSLNGRGVPIALIAIQATNFRLKNDMIQQVQNSCQFHGLSGDDANKHLDKFLHVAQSIKVNEVTDDALRLYLFPHSLTHHATAWFDRLPRNSINSFEQMAKMFLGIYFPPSMVTKLRNEIINFRQRPDESLLEAWERYKILIDRCPNHNMLHITQIDTFYNGLTLRRRDTINAAAGGTFMKRRPEECYDQIENMTAHHNDWDTSAQRSESSSSITSSSDTKIAALKAEMAEINKNLMRVLQVNQQVKAVTPNYETCGGPHSHTDYPTTVGQTQNVYAARAYQGSRTLPSNTITNPKEDLKGITTRSGTAYQGPTIPTTSSLPPVVECETEVTRDMVHPTNNESTKYVQPSVVQTESPIQNSEPIVAPIIKPVVAPVSALKPNLKPLIPYPLRHHDQKLHALILMPKFYPTIKTLLTNKDKLSELARTPLNEHCSVVLLKMFPEKLGDPDKFLNPCDFLRMDECLALADLGASINLMPLLVWNKLLLFDLSPTCMTLELANRSISRSVGVAEDVFVKVGTFHFSAEFVVVDFDADPRVPLILKRSFLKTGRTLIDVFEGELTLRVGKEAITFNLDQTSRYSANYNDIVRYTNLFLPLDNPELTIRRRSRSDPTLLNSSEMADEGPGDLPVHDLRTMEELCQPSLNGRDGQMFLEKYFPPSMVTKLRNEITNFRQRPDESLFEAWECYKLSIDRCQRSESSSSIISSSDTEIATLKAKMAEINKNIIRVLQVNQKVKAVTPNCKTCGGPHSFSNCPATVGNTQNIPQPQVITTNEFTNFMKANDAILKNMQTNMTSLTNSNLELKNMFSQFIKMNTTSSSGLRTLSNKTITNPKEDLKGITTHSGTAYRGPTIPTTISSPIVECKTEATKETVHPTNNGSTEDVQHSVVQSESLILTSEPVASPVSALKPNIRPSIPYPSRLQDQKLRDKANDQQLFDRSISRSVGVAEDVYVIVGTFHFSADFVVVDFDADLRVPIILRRSFLKIKRALIDVFEANYNDMTANRIDVIDMACEEYSQEVLSFSNVITSGNPTPYYDPIISTTSLTLTPFGNSDFLLKKVDAFLALEDDPTSSEVDQSYLDSEGDILLLEAFLNNDPSLPPLNQGNYLPEDLPPHLEYAFLEGDNKLPVIIAKDLSVEEKTALITVLKSHKRAFAWKLSDIKGIDPEFCTHKTLMEEDFEPVPGTMCTKKGGFTVVENEENELILTHLITGWRICIDYHKLNEATRKDHCPLPFMDQMLERLAGNHYYCFLNGFSGYFQIPIDLKDQEKTTFTCPYRTFGYQLSLPFRKDVEKEGIEVDKAKVDVITKLPYPTTVKGIRSFLGHAGFYRRFTKVFSKIARQMTRLLEKDTPFYFSKERVEAFQTLKRKLTEALILIDPD